LTGSKLLPNPGTKGLVGHHSAKGSLACLRHVISYTICTGVIVGAMWAIFGLQIACPVSRPGR
jgi:hypothetical protein